MKGLLKEPLVIDGRNIYEPSEMERLGFRYVSMGRAVVDGRVGEYLAVTGPVEFLTERDVPELTADSVLYLFGKRDVADMLESAVTAIPAKGVTLRIIDADVLSGMNSKQMVKILNVVNTEYTKPVIVDLTGKNKSVLNTAESLGVSVVRKTELTGAAPEEIANAKAITSYKLAGISALEVLSSIANAGCWSYAVSIRYIICAPNMTNIGLLNIYKALPDEIKEALNKHGINIKTIERADIHDITPDSFTNKYGKNAVVEVAA